MKVFWFFSLLLPAIVAAQSDETHYHIVNDIAPQDTNIVDDPVPNDDAMDTVRSSQSKIGRKFMMTMMSKTSTPPSNAPSDTPSDTPSNAPSDTPTPTCKDEPDWKQPDETIWKGTTFAGLGCDDLEKYVDAEPMEMVEEWCSFLSQSIISTKTASNACCFCGGGKPAAEHCEDYEWAKLENGITCTFINQAKKKDDLCEKFGDVSFNKEGITLNQACCACGGGSTTTRSGRRNEIEDFVTRMNGDLVIEADDGSDEAIVDFRSSSAPTLKLVISTDSEEEGPPGYVIFS